MLHWLSVAVHTYVLHPLSGNGYAWWSGAGSDLSEGAILLAVWKHVNCREPRCLRLGHRHPDHGQPVCRKHHHSTAAKPPPKDDA